MTGRTARVDSERDFFISYTGADVAWAEWIADTLERAGYTTVLQAWDFRPGEVFVQRMHQAVEQARRTLLVLSPAYLESAFATAEWQATFAKDPTGDHALLPVRIAACQPVGLLRGRTYLDLVGLDKPAATQRLLDGIKQDRARPPGRLRFPGTATVASSEQARRFPARRPANFRVPPRNPPLHRPQRAAGAPAPAARRNQGRCGGPGLVGYCRAARRDPWPARRVGPPAWHSRGYRASRDDRGALRRAPWPGPLAGCRRQRRRPKRPAPLVAARLRAGGGHFPQPRLGWYRRNHSGGRAPRAEAVAFLRRHLGLEDPAFEVLAAALGDLPSALEQAAAYLEANDVGPVDYLSLLRDRARELFALGRTATTERTVATTWTVSLDRFREQVPAAEDLLALCAFLAADDIPRDLPAQHPDLLPDRLAAAVGDPLAYQQAVGTLRRYSLITTTGDSFRLHRLVQAVTRQSLTAEDRQRWGTVAVRVVLASFPDRADDADTWPAAARMLPHGLAVTDHPAADMTDPQATVRLLNRITDYLWGRGDYAEAKPLAERVFDRGVSPGPRPPRHRPKPQQPRRSPVCPGRPRRRPDPTRARPGDPQNPPWQRPPRNRPQPPQPGLCPARPGRPRHRPQPARARPGRPRGPPGADHPDTLRSRQNLATVVAALDEQW
jgi:hypothetical protein